MTACHALPDPQTHSDRFDPVLGKVGDPAIRTSDAEREQIITLLREHAAQGRLTMDEFEGRMEAAYAAKTRGELAALVADLPEGLRAWQAATRAPQRERHIARYRRALKAEWGGWAFVGALNVAIWLLVCLAAGTLVYFWPMWVIGPWGAVLLARTVFAPHPAHRPLR